MTRIVLGLFLILSAAGVAGAQAPNPYANMPYGLAITLDSAKKAAAPVGLGVDAGLPSGVGFLPWLASLRPATLAAVKVSVSGA